MLFADVYCVVLRSLTTAKVRRIKSKNLSTSNFVLVTPIDPDNAGRFARYDIGGLTTLVPCRICSLHLPWLQIKIRSNVSRIAEPATADIYTMVIGKLVNLAIKDSGSCILKAMVAHCVLLFPYVVDDSL